MEALLTKPRVPSRWGAAQVAAMVRTALLDELNTWPKPGLVSHIDQGSHNDMDARTFERSADAITPFFGQLFEAGFDADMSALRQIGLAAEEAMLAATGGVNTHRGAIFGLGLLCAAAGALTSDQASIGAADLGDTVHRRWGVSIMRGPIPLRSHGAEAWRRFGAGGARAQAAAGFPHALEIGLPTLKRGRLQTGDAEAARVQAFFALLAVVEDTNLLHRGGAEGLSFAQGAAQDFLRDGGIENPDWLARASAIHDSFVARRLSPGGSADLLAISLFFEALETRSMATVR